MDGVRAVKFVFHNHVFNAAKIIKDFLALKPGRNPSAVLDVIIASIELDLSEGRDGVLHRHSGGVITLGQLSGRGSVTVNNWKCHGINSTE